jgi:sensor domain DACNV-containing protein
MPYGSFPGSRSVAQRVQDHFARSVEAGHPSSTVQVAAPVPEVSAIEALIDAAFWTSLRREEVYVPKISLALLPPDATPLPIRFERHLSLSPAALARVAPAVERPGIHLGVWTELDGLSVWGTTRSLPKFCMVLEVAAPGLIVIKQHRGGENTKFTNVAVIEGDQVKVVDETASSLPDCPSLLTSLLGFDSPGLWGESVNVLVQIAVSMRAHGRGGLLLVVPGGSDAWRESIVSPMGYALSPAYAELRQLMRRGGADREHRGWRESLQRAVDAIAGLTAVDGATLLTDTYDLLGFGAKIARRRGSAPVEQVTVTEPVEGAVAAVEHPTQLGGTRHLSAAQFVFDQRHAVALVASQDGRFTIFAWSPCEEMVHAHRVETLLL